MNNQLLGFTFGGISCMTAALVTHPIDTMKVRLQLQGELSKESGKYNGLIRGIRVIIFEEGISGLYKGISASLLREATYSTMRMGLYDPFKKLISNGKKEELHQKIIAGGLSGALASSFATPSDLIKIRLQANSKRSFGLYDAFRDIIRNEGLKGLYRGIGPTTQRAIILTASQLSSYDHSKQLLMKNWNFKEGFATHCVSSMIAGFICATATSPIDLIKSRYMNQKFSNGKGIKYKSTFDCLIKTVNAEGLRGLFKGWTPQWLRIGPHTIITFVVLEQLRIMAGISPI